MKITRYKFRAECLIDIHSLFALLPKKKLIYYTLSPLKPGMASFPDMEANVEIEDMSIIELKDMMKKVEDGHVMWQTLALGEEYTGIRNIEQN
jgi:hypothetical protein